MMLGRAELKLTLWAEDETRTSKSKQVNVSAKNKLILTKVRANEIIKP